MMIRLFLLFTLLLTFQSGLFSQEPLPPAQRINGTVVRQALDKLAEFSKESVVKITNVAGRPVVNGIVVKENGLILTKASELNQRNTVVLNGGKSYRAYYVGEDKDTDLALLKIDATDLQPLDFGDDSKEEIGNWLVTALYNKTKIGIVSATKREIKRVTGVIGIILGEESDGGIVISRAVENGPAHSAGLRGGAILMEVDRKEIKTREALLSYLKGKSAGVKVHIKYKQDDKVKETDITLGDRSQTFKEFNRNLEMSGTISKRTDGFKNIIQHDIPLEHFETGSPLLGINGKVIGVNIAKANRSEAYALPNSVVKNSLDKLLKMKMPEMKKDDKVKQGQVSLVDLKNVQNSLKKMLPAVKKTTVGLIINGASGSGVVISENGYILTAAHVSQRPGSRVTVIMADGKRYKGKSLGSHSRSDIGLVKITDEVKLPFSKPAKAAAQKTGDWCFALGYPGGYNKERGAVVRIGKIIDIRPNTVWTDCTLLGGDSGGPLFNFNGEVIGINSRIFNTSEDNLHGPADLYLDFKEELENSQVIKNNRKTAFLGVATESSKNGLVVTEVVEGSSAAKAGILSGDIINKIGDKKLFETEELIRLLRGKKVGQKIDIQITREKEEKLLKIKLGPRP